MTGTALNTNSSARKSREKKKQQTASPSKQRDDSESQEDSDQMNNNLNVSKVELRRSLSANTGVRNRKVSSRYLTRMHFYRTLLDYFNVCICLLPVDLYIVLVLGGGGGGGARHNLLKF